MYIPVVSAVIFLPLSHWQIRAHTFSVDSHTPATVPALITRVGTRGQETPTAQSPHHPHCPALCLLIAMETPIKLRPPLLASLPPGHPVVPPLGDLGLVTTKPSGCLHS